MATLLPAKIDLVQDGDGRKPRKTCVKMETGVTVQMETTLRNIVLFSVCVCCMKVCLSQYSDSQTEGWEPSMSRKKTLRGHKMI